MLEVGNGQMSDAGYMTHFSMCKVYFSIENPSKDTDCHAIGTGSVLKSPLIIGTDVPSLSTSDFSILVNPAIIAVNQDPLGISAQLRWNTSNTQLWSGPLSPTGNSTTTLDMVVALVNIGNSTTDIEASMSDIFAGQTPGAPNWAINNLWGARLNDTQAQAIMSDGAAAHTEWIYNATEVPYATGLAQKEPLLLGTYVNTVSANETIQVTVEANGCAILRLQALQ
jgi:alpha-galactosidase